MWLPLHIVAGFTAITAGAIALWVRKGGRLHRRSGRVFVWAMLAMAGIGGTLAAFPHHHLDGRAVGPKLTSVAAGLLALYLVTTGLLTVRARGPRARWIDAGTMTFALALAGFDFWLGRWALSRPDRALDGVPAFMLLLFASIALLAAIGDARLLVADGIHGAPRIARHLWRMGLVFFQAASALFLGQAKVFPAPLRGPVLAAPVLAVVVLTIYWAVRVRVFQRVPRAEELPAEKRVA